MRKSNFPGIIALMVATLIAGLMIGSQHPATLTAYSINPDIAHAQAAEAQQVAQVDSAPLTAPDSTVGTEQGLNPNCDTCYADYLRFAQDVIDGRQVTLVDPGGEVIDVFDFTTNPVTSDAQFEGNAESYGGDPAGFIALAPELVSYYFSNGGYAFSYPAQAGQGPAVP